ncbi:MAG TPA: hypothetical protein VN158_01440 [Caulobacter sp.]|nr:hypothetical protein [Caulobacter sp.]
MLAGKIVTAGVAIALLAATAASAQQQPAQPPSQANTDPQMWTAPPAQAFHSLEVDGWRQAMTERAAIKARTAPEQWRRAQQAAALINANQCDNAYKLAVIEQDDRLANNVKRTCKARPPS